MTPADRLAESLRRMLAVYKALMPGIRYIAVQDYAELNEAPIEARQALAAYEARRKMTDRELAVVLHDAWCTFGGSWSEAAVAVRAALEGDGERG